MGEYDWYSRSKLIGSLKLEDRFRKSDQVGVGPEQDLHRTKTGRTGSS